MAFAKAALVRWGRVVQHASTLGVKRHLFGQLGALLKQIKKQGREWMWSGRQIRRRGIRQRSSAVTESDASSSETDESWEIA